MYKVTELFFARGLRVDQLHTDTKIAPFGGTVLFLMDGIICADRVRVRVCGFVCVGWWVGASNTHRSFSSNLYPNPTTIKP